MALAKSPDQRYAAAGQGRAGLSELARDEGPLFNITLIARRMRDRFSEAAANGAACPEEFSNMADNKGGSDLDVFEGLAKKSSRATSPALVPPSPPTRQRTLVGAAVPPPPNVPAVPPPAPAVTLPGGMASPLLPPPPVSAKGASPGSLPPPVPVKGTSPGSLPPPMPPSVKPASLPPPVSAKGTSPGSLPPPVSAKGTSPGSLPPPMPPSVKPGSLPPVVAPPSRQSVLPPVTAPALPSKSPVPPAPTSALPPVVPPPVRVPSVKPPQKAADEGKPQSGKGAAVDMDWDDDEESTHVYDRPGSDSMPGRTTPLPTVSSPALPKAAAALLASSGGAAPAARTRTPIPTPPPIPSAPPAPALPSEIGHRSLSRNDEPTAIRPRPATQQGAGKAGVLLGGLALVAVLILAVVMLVPKKGALTIDLKAPGGTSVARAEIFIDGQKRCDTVPCVVRELDPGSKVVKILAPDFPPHDAVEVVEGGKEKVVVITLDGAAAARASTNGSTATGVKASGAQPGVKVFIDGVEKGTLPLEVSVSPGEHKIRFDGGERYEPVEQTVEVGQGQTKDLGTVALKVLKGQVTLDLATSGAAVKLVSAKGTEKKLPDSAWKKPPVKVDVNPSEGWKIVAKKKGYTDFSQAISFEDGQAEKTIRIALEEASNPEPAAAAPVAAAAPAPAPDPAPAAPAPKSEAPAAAPKAEAPAAAPAAAAGNATLNINSIPVSKVVLDGRPLGSTPKVGVSVPAGSHTVTFIHSELGKKSVTVSVKAGETKTAAVRFD
ncbi:PEGA domain-containing protein [Sorangium sp. So ce185]|uniref:PEGA domain-containing protein n=1 Tax=Sorangium sp. So ce185 TaxID=3133287 RepID=UPI003F63FB9B